MSVSVEVDHVERDMERLKVATSDIQESKGQLNYSINSENTFINVYCHFTDSGNAIKSPDAGTQPADSEGATVEHQGTSSCI